MPNARWFRTAYRINGQLESRGVDDIPCCAPHARCVRADGGVWRLLGLARWSCLRGKAALDPAGRRVARLAMGIASSREEAYSSCFVCAR
jgi:hypothetical protein